LFTGQLSQERNSGLLIAVFPVVFIFAGISQVIGCYERLLYGRNCVGWGVL